MKFRLLFALLLITCLPAVAQETEKGFLALTGGLAVPSGNFGDKSVTNKYASAADKGLHATIGYVASLHKNFGIGVIYGLRRNTPDFAAFNEANRQAQTGNQYYSDENYRSNYLLLEGVLKFPISENLGLYCKAGAGFSFNTLPRVYTNKTTGININQFPKVTADAFAYGLGAGLRYQPGLVGFGGEVSYISTSPTFEGNGIEAELDFNSLNYSLAVFFRIR